MTRPTRWPRMKGDVMEEKAICAKCGRHVEYVITLSTSGRKPTPPLCSKCFDAACDAIPKLAREGK